VGLCRRKLVDPGEFLKMIAVTMTAKEATARLEGELSALKARPCGVGLPGDL